MARKSFTISVNKVSSEIAFEFTEWIHLYLMSLSSSVSVTIGVNTSLSDEPEFLCFYDIQCEHIFTWWARVPQFLWNWVWTHLYLMSLSSSVSVTLGVNTSLPGESEFLCFYDTWCEHIFTWWIWVPLFLRYSVWTHLYLMSLSSSVSMIFSLSCCCNASRSCFSVLLASLWVSAKLAICVCWSCKEK